MIRFCTIGCLLGVALAAQEKPTFQPRVPAMQHQDVNRVLQEQNPPANLPQERQRETPQQQMRRWMQEQRAKNQQWQRAEAKGEEKVPDKCAHIITYVPPKDVDPGMSIGKFTDNGRMKTVPAMPTCEEDVRVLPSLNKTPEPPSQPAEKK